MQNGITEKGWFRVNAIGEHVTPGEVVASHDARRFDTVKMRQMGGVHYMPCLCTLAPEAVPVLDASVTLPPELNSLSGGD
jgi:hypothetical protein